ncbi:hypothetical protein LEN26_001633 [Aphanomyces euteiches]|uniref:Transmembrane protein 222 n=1 Tax=Aphanomyces euteiches TaxID=100861 RepID=A0A6G0WGJ9_9STRA|nr:hypothetical protein Ae201684_015468 [Aphanomyces euteiches]KAH9097797.1 hypothetical protein Ae201684P_001272 [Aphanomyces euteiches]KAH9115912.1 hypothetical protein AeMF1_010096 [Aphanomyces euteiches]KAH9147991.1 hypothetical protein AeRB84_008503 [Aphanomyces euteiches]KAH9148106.1 hypothetical protein AeRB84_008430 [Aphanomyces euteiches]
MSAAEDEHRVDDKSLAIDVSRDRFPFSIVWTPLPMITWLIPIIGHMGIADSNGVIYDFAGPYFIGEDDFAFGRPTRYLQLTLPDTISPEVWDDGVRKGCEIYKKRMHNICCDNCHSHVARCLNSMNFPCPMGQWNMIWLCFYMLFWGRFVNVRGAILTWTPFCCIVAVILVAALYSK